MWTWSGLNGKKGGDGKIAVGEEIFGAEEGIFITMFLRLGLGFLVMGYGLIDAHGIAGIRIIERICFRLGTYVPGESHRLVPWLIRSR